MNHCTTCDETGRWRKGLLYGASVVAVLTLWGNVSVAEPRLECDQSTYDFGSMMDTQTVIHTFVLRNTGDAAATDLHVHSTCSCTSALPSREAIPPGEKELLTVQFNLKGRRGRQMKPVYVTWNGGAETRALRLLMSGTIGVSRKGDLTGAESSQSSR